MTTFKNKAEAEAIVGTLSSPSKMPCHGYSIPARHCHVGKKMKDVKGSVCASCYALKGRYLFGNVQNAMEKRYQSLNDPRWADAMTYLIGQTGNPFFRWHDSGDLQSVKHLTNIVKVAKALPHVSFWLPSREYGIISNYVSQGGEIPDNLTIRLSALMIDGPAPEAIANRLGLVVSGVSKEAGFTCPSSTQGNVCGDCRACWDKSTFSVSYKKH